MAGDRPNPTVRNSPDRPQAIFTKLSKRVPNRGYAVRTAPMTMSHPQPQLQTVHKPKTERVEMVLAMLRRQAEESTMIVTADQRVGEKDAARLIGMHPDTLRRKRGEGTGPDFHHLGVGGSSYSYRFADLAVFVDEQFGEKSDIRRIKAGKGGSERLIK